MKRRKKEVKLSPFGLHSLKEAPQTIYKGVAPAHMPKITPQKVARESADSKRHQITFSTKEPALGLLNRLALDPLVIASTVKLSPLPGGYLVEWKQNKK